MSLKKALLVLCLVLPIIAVNRLATSEQVPIDKTAEYTAFLPKPYTTQELLKTLYAVINH
ncbi:hypothetical protein [Nostoc sp. 'Lobaria pulmonaria (5183) cyanobiont']|uniref:hypothetical protein n=1 Tax=Nostoc sp. 'Lobaria pulmonaria (5183) cyanobiont' TaxID=1618022 RepID=UPI00131A4617|nr:hypothetical protein [Nostoc sp. 'Lobaria pulmonaria (5183) cyanobiont']